MPEIGMNAWHAVIPSRRAVFSRKKYASKKTSARRKTSVSSRYSKGKYRSSRRKTTGTSLVERKRRFLALRLSPHWSRVRSSILRQGTKINMPEFEAFVHALILNKKKQALEDMKHILMSRK